MLYCLLVLTPSAIIPLFRISKEYVGVKLVRLISNVIGQLYASCKSHLRKAYRVADEYVIPDRVVITSEKLGPSSYNPGRSTAKAKAIIPAIRRQYKPLFQ